MNRGPVYHYIMERWYKMQIQSSDSSDRQKAPLAYYYDAWLTMNIICLYIIQSNTHYTSDILCYVTSQRPGWDMKPVALPKWLMLPYVLQQQGYDPPPLEAGPTSIWSLVKARFPQDENINM